MPRTDIYVEVQMLLRNAKYLGDGYVQVLTLDIEALQETLRAHGIEPNEPESAD